MTTESPQPHTAKTASAGVTVILPAYNEEAALPIVVQDIRDHVDRAQIVVVDDGSRDNTAQVGRELGCEVVTHDHNLGKGSALRSGVAVSTGDYIICMDADATYPASAIPEMVGLLDTNDFVRAERAIDSSNTPLLNRVGNVAIGTTLRTLHGLGSGDHLSGLYGFKSGTLEALGTQASGFDIEVEIGIKAKEQGLSVATLPIEYLPRVGDKKLRPAVDGAHILSRILLLVLIYRPLLLFGFPGVLILAASLVGAVALSGGPLVTDYLGLSIHTFIVSALGVLAGFQLITFGIAGAEYRKQLGFQTSSLLASVTSPTARAITGGIGLVLAILCGGWLIVTIVGWLLSGGPEFTATRSLVFTATGAVFGLQLLSASLFITLLSNRTG